MAKKTQAQLLEEVIELLKPINNLARYYIQSINTELARQKALAETEVESEEVKSE